MKTPKFLIANNPMIDGTQYVIHTKKPRITARIFEFDEADVDVIHECMKNYDIGGRLDYPPSVYIYAAVWIEEDDYENAEVHVKKLSGIMRRMADWHKSYLITQNVSPLN